MIEAELVFVTKLRFISQTPAVWIIASSWRWLGVYARTYKHNLDHQLVEFSSLSFGLRIPFLGPSFWDLSAVIPTLIQTDIKTSTLGLNCAIFWLSRFSWDYFGHVLHQHQELEKQYVQGMQKQLYSRHRGLGWAEVMDKNAAARVGICWNPHKIEHGPGFQIDLRKSDLSWWTLHLYIYIYIFTYFYIFSRMICWAICWTSQTKTPVFFKRLEHPGHTQHRKRQAVPKLAGWFGSKCVGQEIAWWRLVHGVCMH